jgi:hypothetical protein
MLQAMLHLRVLPHNATEIARFLHPVDEQIARPSH